MAMDLNKNSAATSVAMDTEYNKITIEVKQTDMSIEDVITYLIRPLLIGIGYPEKLVNEYLGG